MMVESSMPSNIDDPRTQYLLSTIIELFGDKWSAHDHGVPPLYLNKTVTFARNGREHFEYDLKRNIIKRLQHVQNDYVFTPTYTHHSWWNVPFDDDQSVRKLLIALHAA
jgi:hypothetical protein